MLTVNAAAFAQSGEAAAAPYAQGESSGDESPVLPDGALSNGPRRRFVKPTVTAYEHNFSRNAAGRRFHRRAGAQPRAGLASYSFLQSNQNQNDEHVMLAEHDENSTSFANLAALAAAADADEDPAANMTSTAMVAKNKAAPRVSSLSSVLNEVMHGRQRALSNFVDATAPQHNPRRFVVQQDPHGAFFVSSSNNPKYAAPPAKPTPVALPTITSPTAAASPAMRRSDLDDGARKSSGHRKWPLTRRSLSRSKERDDDDAKDARSPTKNALSLSSIKSKLQAARSRNSMTRDAPMTLDEMEDDAPAVLGGSHSKGVAPPSASGGADELPMLDPDLVDSRARGDSSWEVPPTHQPLTPAQKQQIVNRPLPYQSSGAFNADDDEDEEDDNLLNRSFLNVRDIEFNPRTHDEDDSPPVSVPADTLDKEDSDEDDGTEDEDRREHTTSSDAEGSASSQLGTPSFDAHHGSSFSGSGSGSSVASASAPVGPVRVSASNANVSEFLGGFKGGFANRTRSMRNNRKSAVTQAATVLTRKLRDARSRIPLEFRDDAAQPLPRKKASKKLRVRWDSQLDYVREFEVESEEETEPDIVKAPWEYDENDLAEEERENREDDDDDDDEDEWRQQTGSKW
uniref:Uncharacterized protein n=1 Tax=Globisporangium ultimum (strain ATCC 200006 / CBS 805.95 / DAOM BR144) TaxID=431595 RepID=K3W568_GLOUD